VKTCFSFVCPSICLSVRLSSLRYHQPLVHIASECGLRAADTVGCGSSPSLVASPRASVTLCPPRPLSPLPPAHKLTSSFVPFCPLARSMSLIGNPMLVALHPLHLLHLCICVCPRGRQVLDASDCGASLLHSAAGQVSTPPLPIGPSPPPICRRDCQLSPRFPPYMTCLI